MILSETISMFKSGGDKQLEERMVRACLNDLDKLRDRIRVEVQNALILNALAKSVVSEWDDTESE